MTRDQLHACLLFLAALLGTPSAAAQISIGSAEPEKPAAEATVIVYNREIAVLRTDLLGIPPALRASRAEDRIREQLISNKTPVVSVESNPLGAIFKLDGVMVFALTQQDADALSQQNLQQAVADARKRLENVIAESSAGRSVERLMHSIGYSAVATAILIGLLWLFGRVRRAIGRKLAALTENKRLALNGVELVPRLSLLGFLLKLNRLVYFVIAALLVYEWLSFCMAQFPYTRPWADGLNGFLFGMAAKFGTAILGAVPNLLTATAIFLLAYWLIGLTKGFFNQIASGKARFGNLDAELANPTRKLVSALIWIFALVMAYPYLPGSDSAAFKGVSVLLGLMLSLGSSNIISQGASGLILTFSKTFRIGEYVKIGDHEGTVSALGIFNTRLRTGMGEEVTLSNAGVFSSTIRNYSRNIQGEGYILDTTVTIGYDTPWRQVEAMLLEAAGRTNGISTEPPPRVFQTALSDFYPEYRLVCNATAKLPKPRAVALSDLHANIQDVFNQFGVQIMSPHYMHDPQHEKTVSEERKYAAPAKQPE
jgi:small-conductance mechanosensitive channel